MHPCKKIIPHAALPAALGAPVDTQKKNSSSFVRFLVLGGVPMFASNGQPLMQNQPAFVSAQSGTSGPTPVAEQQQSPAGKSGKSMETDDEPTPKVTASVPGGTEDIEELEFKESNLTSVERAPRAQRVMDQREMNLWMQLSDPKLSSGDGGTNDFGDALGAADPQDFVYVLFLKFQDFVSNHGSPVIFRIVQNENGYIFQISNRI